MLRAAVQGFLAEMGRQAASPEVGGRVTARLAELKNPVNVLDFALG